MEKNLENIFDNCFLDRGKNRTDGLSQDQFGVFE